MKHLMIAINWYGPYKCIDEARECAKNHYCHGLYMALGKCKYERIRKMQYIGIGNNLFNRLTEEHPKLSQIIHDRSFWLGEIDTAEPSGKKLKVTRPTLDYAEWLHARFLQLQLNDKKTKGLPKRSVTVLNRWYKTDYLTPIRRRPHKDWPDLIDFPFYELPARAVWFGRSGQKSLFIQVMSTLKVHEEWMLN